MAGAAPFANAMTDIAWVLSAPGAGDNRQLEALAEILDIETRWIPDFDAVGRVLSDRLFRRWRRAVPPDKASWLEPPWPRLVLLAGGRSVIDACRIRDASGGRSRLVCLGRPWAPLDWFDLVVTTPQYGLPPASNVLTLDLPLNLPVQVPPEQLAHWRDRFDGLPRPLVGALMGGTSGSYRFTHACAQRLADSLNEIVFNRGGSAVIVGSPRTPESVVRYLDAHFRGPGQVFGWSPGGGPGPFRALLELADRFVVTGDSASMLADAAYTGRPLSIFDLSERVPTRINRMLRRWTQPLQPVQDRLAAGGWWVPMRDMRKVHTGLTEAGRVVPIPSLHDAVSGYPDAKQHLRSLLRSRILPLLSGRIPETGSSR